MSSAKKNYLVLPRSFFRGLQLSATNSFDTPILFDVSLFLLRPPLITSLRHFYSKRKHCLPGSSETQFSISFTILEIFFKDMISIFRSILNIILVYFTAINILRFTTLCIITVIFQVCNVLITKSRFYQTLNKNEVFCAAAFIFSYYYY